MFSLLLSPGMYINIVFQLIKVWVFIELNGMIIFVKYNFGG